MHEDQLSPLLGRLIDRAKAAAEQAEPGLGAAEAIALLLDDERIVAAHGVFCGAASGASAAERALSQVLPGTCGTVEAAAVVVYAEQGGGAWLSSESRRALEAVDPRLPLVLKQRGRWVVKSLADLPEGVGSP